MEYDFGDILDARNAPDGHFIIVVGEISRKDKITKNEVVEVMYYLVTSRVYTVFNEILVFFNDCLLRRDKHFLHYFNKEKDKRNIIPHGLLSQSVFLDKKTNYNTCLDVDSMVVINSDPRLVDKTALESLKSSGKVLYKSRLVKIDTLNLIQIIKDSNAVSPDSRSKIFTCFKKIKLE
jgi:hypothetical protein